MTTPVSELVVTHHAIDQFIAKIDPRLSPQAAKDTIRQIYSTSQYVPPKKRKGGTKKRLEQSIRVAFYQLRWGVFTLFLVIKNHAIVTLYPVVSTRSGYCNFADSYQ